MDRKTAICIGNFDGLHIGHRRLINSFLKRARTLNLRPLLITFRPHPIIFFNPDKRYLLCDYEKKIELIRDLYPSIEINISEFNKDLQGLSAKDYVEKDLIPKDPGLICVGHDLQLGKDKRFATEVLSCELPNCELLEIDPALDEQRIISSSLVRESLAAGKIVKVKEYLLRDFSIYGSVATGKKLGREIGFPTLNLDVNKNIMVPKYGVYAVEVLLLGEKFQGVMNIGNNPTVSSTKSIKVEVHVLNFSRDVYGEQVEVRFKEFIREEKKFGSIDELKAQIKKDALEVESYFEL